MVCYSLDTTTLKCYGPTTSKPSLPVRQRHRPRSATARSDSKRPPCPPRRRQTENASANATRRSRSEGRHRRKKLAKRQTAGKSLRKREPRRGTASLETSRCSRRPMTRMPRVSARHALIMCLASVCADHPLSHPARSLSHSRSSRRRQGNDQEPRPFKTRLRVVAKRSVVVPS